MLYRDYKLPNKGVSVNNLELRRFCLYNVYSLHAAMLPCEKERAAPIVVIYYSRHVFYMYNIDIILQGYT